MLHDLIVICVIAICACTLLAVLKVIVEWIEGVWQRLLQLLPCEEKALELRKRLDAEAKAAAATPKPVFDKEPWEMNWPEYLAHRVAIEGYQAPPIEWGDLSKQRAQHEEAIRVALENGEAVPTEVLKEYPR